MMPEDNTLTRAAFDYLAQQAGLDPQDSHMEDLFPSVQSALAGIERLKEIDVAGEEPDMGFNPAQAYRE